MHPLFRLIKGEAFTKRIQRLGKRKADTLGETFGSKTNNRSIGTKEQLRKFKSYRDMSNAQKLMIPNLSKTVARLKA